MRSLAGIDRRGTAGRFTTIMLLVACLGIAQVALTAPVRAQSGAAPGEAALRVSGYRFAGNTAFSQEELAGLLAEDAGKESTLSELEEAAARITRFYREHGYLFASAYVPPQEVIGGVVEIAVAEGRYGEVALGGDAPLSEPVVRGLLGDVRPGALIETRSLDRALRLLNETPGVQARAALRPGAAAGTADLAVELSRTKAVSARIAVDNAGNPSIDRLRASFAAEVANAAGLGDRLSVRWLGSGAAMGSLHAAYEAYAAAPWRWSLSYANTRYALGGAFANLDAFGTGSVLRLSARYPVERSGLGSQDLSLGYEVKTLSDVLLGEETAARVQALSVQVNWTRRAAGAGAWSGEAWVSLRPGAVEFLGEEAADDDAAAAGATGSFAVLEAGFSARKPLSQRTALYVSASGQWASKNLYRSEKFSLGGVDGVRAYPAGEASGDAGAALRTDLRYTLPIAGRRAQALEGSLFLDAGSVAINQNPWPGGDEPNVRTLAGAGFGVAYAVADTLSVRLEYAAPVGLGAPVEPGAGPQVWLKFEARL